MAGRTSGGDDDRVNGTETTPAPRRGLPLWVRIALAALLTFAAAAGASGAWLASRVVATAERELEEGLLNDLGMVEPSVRRALLAGDREALREIADGARSRGEVRVTVILPDGEVVAESGHALPVAPHGDRPEVRAAMAGGLGRDIRRSSTTGENYIYLARRVEGPDGRPAGVLRLARPDRIAAQIRSDLGGALWISLAIGLGVASLVGWLAARRIAAPLEEMTDTADRMAAGDFSRTARAGPDDETGRLASALDRLGAQVASMLQVRDAANAELAAILASMQEGVLALDRDGRVVHANAAVATCLGLPSVPAAGTPIAEIVRLPEVSSQLRRALGGEGAPEIDVTLPGTAGRVIGVGAAPVASPGGVRGAVLVMRDVTTIRNLERTRLDFVANVSHELRTPLAAVIGSVETIEALGDDDPDARARLLATAHRHGKRLGAIVDDLLALSQIEGEGDRMERAPVPLLRGIRGALSAVAADAAARSVVIDPPPGDAPDPVVLGHEGRLEQVWTNLLANAVKYNVAGGRVRLGVAVDDARKEAVVTVSDTGQGIPAEHLPRIFERFYRVDKGRSRDQGGTGLGLAIVKHIVLAHRGRIFVESRPGQGSTFRVAVPLAAQVAG